jgi:hypothetical protein
MCGRFTEVYSWRELIALYRFQAGCSPRVNEHTANAQPIARNRTGLKLLVGQTATLPLSNSISCSGVPERRWPRFVVVVRIRATSLL